MARCGRLTRQTKKRPSIVSLSERTGAAVMPAKRIPVTSSRAIRARFLVPAANKKAQPMIAPIAAAREPVAAIANACKVLAAKSHGLLRSRARARVSGNAPARNAATKLGFPSVEKARIRAFVPPDRTQPRNSKTSSPAYCRIAKIAMADADAASATARRGRLGSDVVSNANHPMAVSIRINEERFEWAPRPADAPTIAASSNTSCKMRFAARH